ncbi:cellobiohydrolase [Streptomyces sp. Ru87]|uniref:Glucanase n=2 Tax=Streptomyces TaxID=1883 RepID=A0ABQ7FQB7_9ACTN|nr:glycoside hydrolase family 6 protein [Streptomyces lycii]PGH48021.1 cellobiohydrolase [Streptomyces sp. Ru87]
MPGPLSRYRRATGGSPRRRSGPALLAALALAVGLCAATGGRSEAAAGGAARVDNPYAGAQVYVNPEWSAKAAAEPGGEAVSGRPTAVWLDSRASIDGADGTMGLRDHLDAALEQDADLVQLVLHSIPGRDCDRLMSFGELAPGDIDGYRAKFLEPITTVLAEPAYAGLRIVTVVEPSSLQLLVTHTAPRAVSTPLCDEMRANGNYVSGVSHALAELGALPNVYSYLDIGHHAELGWEDTLSPVAEVLLEAATLEGTVADVHGIVANVADYSVLHEPHIDIDDTVRGVGVHQSRWIDWNDYVDEVPYALAFRDELVRLGFDEGLGVLVDTSRNGWGGPGRPAGPGPLTTVDEYVDGGRLDRRLSPANWCNQENSGLGERPAAAPEPGIDAYVWVKPPGESDGASGSNGGWEYDRMCDPLYNGHPGSGHRPTGALPDAPAYQEWFPEHFRQLLANAWPPL